MDDLIRAIHTTPIIDNHAHPLLRPEATSKYLLLAITTEAHGGAMKTTHSSLSHIRAVRQLSEILGCGGTWDEFVKAIEMERSKPDDSWNKRCFQGIETALIDDGLDGEHEKQEKRIVRIENEAENIIQDLLRDANTTVDNFFEVFVKAVEEVILAALRDTEVVGFKSVICYRVGLAEPVCAGTNFEEECTNLFQNLQNQGAKLFKRIENEAINWALVYLTAQMIHDHPTPNDKRKPFQFHTGLGDNDITLTTASPSHLQPLMRKYPEVPFVLLHASYLFTQEAGYLAMVYENVYADIGEIFPFVSKEGQEKAVREILELCPSEKVLWSTDGQWFPETYLLATIQMREALEVVLPEYVKTKVLSISQAIKVVEDIFFSTSNNLYDLGLSMTALPLKAFPLGCSSSTSDLRELITFLADHPTTKSLRLQYLDYTATSNTHLHVGVTKAALGVLQNDTLIPGVSATGEYRLEAISSSLHPGPSAGFASLQCEFRNLDGSEVPICPRSTLKRIVSKAESHGLQFIIGFEIKIVFLSSDHEAQRTPLAGSSGHVWNSARALHNPKLLNMLAEISEALSTCGIDLETWHPESARGQYEFVLPPLPPLASLDTLIQAREIITTVAAKYDLRATLQPKPFKDQRGTAAHAHISISSPNGEDKNVYESFYQGILEALVAIIPFGYSNPTSYERAQDGVWSGGTWIAWGTQNRETVLRKIEGSHWEIKCLDGLANMYLAIAAIVAARTEGVVKKKKLIWADCGVDPATLDPEGREDFGIKEKIRDNLSDALGDLDGSAMMKDVLGAEVVERYVNVKRGEMKLLEGMSNGERWNWVVERY
ncbi:hypothetical protein BJ875DRAFT_519059 [Amylocarpus encephaloides]|uniref:GS catalytic domain-containing protein n=1 Tax=Amylocarpus encephaloides TaxID=45428 RepID=A0A9P7YCY9_9HELO|nr:hypothetical protein BJ875DRAFT_519059 [Amylocarpus encephaloides]